MSAKVSIIIWPGLGGGIVLGLTDIIVPAMGARGFWIAGIIALWTVAAVMAVYLERVSRVEPGAVRQR